MSDPRFSVIIPCYRHAGPLQRCLEGLVPERQAGDFETIVVDSASDGGVSAVVSRFAGVRVRSTAKQLWPGAARNLGARAARGEVLLFLDADCVPEPGWIAAAGAGLDAGARIVGGPVLDLLPAHPIAASDNLLQFAEYPAGRPRGRAAKFPACNLAIRRGDFESLNGFPEDLPRGEDTILVAAAANRWPEGLQFVPNMRVRHLGRTGLRAFLAHQAGSGYQRGVLGSDLTPSQQRLAGRRLMIPTVVVRRLGYVLGRTLAWHPLGLPRALALTPLLVAGLSAYAIGLRRGLQHEREAGAPR